MFFATTKIQTDGELDAITKCLNFIEKNLSKCKLKAEEKKKFELVAEEIIAQMIENKEGKGPILIKIHSLLGKIKIHIACKGRSFDADDIRRRMFFDIVTDEDFFASSKLLNRAIEDHMKINNKNGCNICDIYTRVGSPSLIRMTFFAMVLGVITGLVMKHFPAGTATFLGDNIFNTLYSLFFNALKMVVAPLVFFSVADGISQYSDLGMLGRIAVKALIRFLFTAIIAIIIGFGVYYIFPIGDASLKNLVTTATISQAQNAQGLSLSLKGTILGLIPTDILSPFLTNNTLQIIVVAVLLAISIAMLGECTVFANFISDANKIFSKITSLIVNFMPLAVFCSMANMIYGIDIGSLLKVVVWLPVIYCGHSIMFAVDFLRIFIFTGYNPFTFFKNISPALLTAASTTSGSATMPLTTKCCKENLHISSKVYTFLIPFATAIEKNGTCILLAISSLFMAKIFGVAVTPELIVNLSFMIIMVTMGIANIPGGSLVCMAIIFPVIGVPVEAITLIAGIYPLASMTSTALSVAGNITTTYIIAKSENMIDE